MKNLSYLLFSMLLIFALSINIQAQGGNFDVTEKEFDMALGVQNGLSIVIPEANEKTVLKAWETLMKENKFDKKSKVTTSKSETAALNMMIYGVPTDVYSQVFYQNDGIKLTAFFDMGELGFINSETMPDNYTKMVQFLQNFAYDTSKETVKMELNEEVKMLKQMEGEQRRLEKDNKRLHKAIEEAKKTIADSEKQLEKNLQEQNSKTEELKMQEQKIKGVEERLKGI